MKLTRLQMAGVMVGILFVGIILFLSNRSSEPSYKGRTLSQWLVYYDSREDESTKHDETVEAIKAMGTNCIPTALKWLSEEPTGPSAFIHQNDRSMATEVFRTLGDQAKPAIPALVELTRHKNAEVRLDAFLRLCDLKPDDAIFVPVLVSLVKDPDRTVRYFVLRSRQFGPTADPRKRRLQCRRRGLGPGE